MRNVMANWIINDTIHRYSFVFAYPFNSSANFKFFAENIQHWSKNLLEAFSEVNLFDL